MSQITPTAQTRVKRLPERGCYEREQIYQILDEGLVCHIGFTVDNQTFVIPTAYCRLEDEIFIHGAPASRMLKTLQEGINICLTVTLLDGLVAARSAFHSSMNYRSVMVLGQASAVKDFDEKSQAMQTLVEHIMPGRWPDLREITEKEIRATTILKLPIEEASAKIRKGPPVDDEEDLELPIWGGVMPLATQPLTPIGDRYVTSEVSVPEYLLNYRRPR